MVHLHDNLHVLFGHLLPDLVMHDVAAVAIQDAAQIIERTRQVQIGHIDMPMRMGRQRLQAKPLPFLLGFDLPTAQHTGLAQAHGRPNWD